MTCLRRFHQTAPGGGHLICFPHAGGSASFYRPLSQALHPSIDVLIAQYPGHQDRADEPLIDDLIELAEHFYPCVKDSRSRRTVLFGHSMGGLLAFEIARRLQARTGEPPAAVIVSACHAPERHRRTVTAGPDPDDNLELLGGVPEELLNDESFMESFLPAWRADRRAVRGYPGTRTGILSCPVHAFAADGDRFISVDEVRAWQRHTRAGFRVQIFTGDHLYLRRWSVDFTDALARACLNAGPS